MFCSLPCGCGNCDKQTSPLTAEEAKSKFAKNYFSAVNEYLSKEEDEKLREELRELEWFLMGNLPEKEFQDFYELVHRTAWANSYNY